MNKNLNILPLSLSVTLSPLSFFFSSCLSSSIMRMDLFLCLFQHHESKAELITEPGTFNNLLFRELISINAPSLAPGQSVN